MNKDDLKNVLCFYRVTQRWQNLSTWCHSSSASPQADINSWSWSFLLLGSCADSDSFAIPHCGKSPPIYLRWHIKWSQFDIQSHLPVLFFLIYFYWRIIVLQCCVRLCRSMKWLSSVYIQILSSGACLSAPLGHHRAGSWAPMLHLSFPLTICFNTR